MGRRCLGLLGALALLVVPGAASAAAQHVEHGGHSAERVTVADRHPTAVRVAARASSVRERRTPHHSSSSLAVLGVTTGLTPELGRVDLDANTASAPGEVLSSSRPRAPPAAV